MILRGILAFIAAVVVTEVTIACVNAGFVIGELTALGVEVPFGRRLSHMAEDVIGLAPTFLPVLVIGLAIAFAVAWAAARWLHPGRRGIGYPLAGAACLAVVIFALGQIFDTHPIAATRTTAGLLSILACGALGGGVFQLLLGSRSDGSLERSPA
jgi:hypothetical protein